MRGKQLDNETVYKIMLSVFSTGSYTETSKQLNIPQRTVEDIYKRNIKKEEFTKLREKKQDEFVEKANRIIEKAMNRLEKTLDNEEKDLAINNLSTVIGTLYDKRALAKGDSTENTKLDVNITVVE